MFHRYLDRTIIRVLHKKGIKTHRSYVKNFLTDTNRKIRLDWCKDLKDEPPEHWIENCIFADESKFEITQTNTKFTIRRPRHQSNNLRYYREKIPHGGGSVMVWACISSLGVSDLYFIKENLTGEKYAEIIEDALIPYIRRVCDSTP